jgi:Zn-finger nucleic acid-binding protein
MNCPVCRDTALVMTERQGIEIDYCPQCRGVWLDRGELDKIIERSAVESGPAPGSYRDDRHYSQNYRHRKKKSSFLSEVFDFD